MKEKISFPKGSLSFKRLKPSGVITELEKTDQWRNEIAAHAIRKRYVNGLEKIFPGKIESKVIPKDISNSFYDIISRLQAMRSRFKSIPEFSTTHNYEITFIHPKWSKVLKPIVVNSDKTNIKDSLKLIRERFREAKANHRIIRMRKKTVNIRSLNANISYNVSGGAIYMPEVREGVYVKFLKDQEKRIVFTPKSPKDGGNYVGVELEFLCDVDREKLGLILFDAGVGKQVTVKQDGSLRCCPEKDLHPSQCAKHKNLFEHELCVLLKEDNYKETMKKICDVLSKVNAIVNKSCGMHVHIDMRNRDAEKAYQNLVSSQGILFKMNPKSRSELYAKKAVSREFDDVRTPRGGESRYIGINAQAMERHSTIEIRIHSGTIDYTKITNWIEILLMVSNHKERVINNYISYRKLCDDFGINETLQDYIEERIEKFKTKKELLGEVEPEAERGVA